MPHRVLKTGLPKDLLEATRVLDPKALIERVTAEVGGPALAELDPLHRALVIERSGKIVAAALRSIAPALARADASTGAVLATLAERVEEAAEQYGEGTEEWLGAFSDASGEPDPAPVPDAHHSTPG